ncbi:MAG: hypothetical protein HZA08_11720 [Nitrospirae bacterium]|nr:hypothetical protein [Nitrospirota bacterium]
MVVADGTIYVIGGVDGNLFLDTTMYAKVQKDGALGPWINGPRLNEERGFIGASVYKNHIYVVGGGKGAYGQTLLRSIERAQIMPDGSLGPWVRENHQLVIPRRCSEVAVIGKAIYSFGGFGGAMLDSIERADFMEDGSIGEWNIEKETLTMPRYIHGIQKVDNNIFIIGGHDQMKGIGITDVEWSGLETGGKTNPAWRSTTPLNIGRYGLASAVYDGHLYALGGISGTEYLDSVEKGSINSKEGITQWQATTALPQARATFAAAVYKKWIYILGGSNRDGYLPNVYYATFDDKGDIGFWGTKAEANAYEAAIAGHKNTGPSLPNEGVVQQIIHASAYSYIQVKNGDDISWIAGTKVELKPNTRIRYSKGVYMSNFYSKELQRNFPSVLFVSRIEKVN